MHILIADHLPESGWDALRAEDQITTAGPFPTREMLLDALPMADALVVRSSTVVDAGLLAHAPKLKVVARAGARLENIDIDACTRRGILVLHVPDANIYAAAEHTFGMLIAYARQIPQGYNAIQQGEFPRHRMMGFQLHGKTMGIIGFGRLGREVAARARVFGLHVLVYDPYVDLSFAQTAGVEIVGLEELLSRADIVSLHTVYTGQTQHLIDAHALAQMKSSAVLLNCTHAGLVDETALLAALNAESIAGAVLDTVQNEPPPSDHPLLHHPRVFAVPHLNQNTRESQAETGSRIVADVLAALRAEDFRNAVNLPFTAEQPYRTAAPYLHLAAKLGKLQGQLAGGWITRLDVQVAGTGIQHFLRPITANLLAGMLKPIDGRAVNWISAPPLANEQEIVTAQSINLLPQEDYPNLLACRVEWRKADGNVGSRLVAGVLFANGDARLVQYNDFKIDAEPQGYVIIIENDDIPGVIGKVGTQLGVRRVNIANWRYGREIRGGRALSFINVDQRVAPPVLTELEDSPEIHSVRLVHL